MSSAASMGPAPDGPATVIASLPSHIQEKLAAYRTLRDLRFRVRQRGHAITAPNLLAELGLTVRTAPEDLRTIPTSGPVIFAFNLPLGIQEALLAAAVLPAARRDVRILVNHIIGGISELSPRFIQGDPWGFRPASRINYGAMRNILSALRAGAAVAAFPAGDRIVTRHTGMIATRWRTLLPRLVRSTGAHVVPVHIGDTHGNVLRVRIGDAIPAKAIRHIEDDSDAAAYLRWHVEQTGRRDEVPFRLVPRL